MKPAMLAPLGWLMLTAMRLQASEPFVPAFDRFHSAQPSAEGGRLLFNELGCANCHGGETGLPPRRGPILAGIVHRARPSWVTQFLANPSGAHPGSSIPFTDLTSRKFRPAIVIPL
jgi:cytochrome c2